MYSVSIDNAVKFARLASVGVRWRPLARPLALYFKTVLSPQTDLAPWREQILLIHRTATERTHDSSTHAADLQAQLPKPPSLSHNQQRAVAKAELPSALLRTHTVIIPHTTSLISSLPHIAIVFSMPHGRSNNSRALHPPPTPPPPRE